MKIDDKEYLALINVIREFQSKLTEYQRVDFWEDILEGYCIKCGDKKNRFCYCEDDT